MEKPRIFISAVTRELGSARQRVAHILIRKGYEPVWQDIFGTEPGDLRVVLREKIDSCAGLIQITGDACGAEPANPDPVFGRCSYTQFEFLYALQEKKKTWLLLAGPHCTRDHPPAELDLPRTPHPDPVAWQQERSELQRLYKERPEFRQHLRHTAESDLALDLATERLHDELTDLRAETYAFQNNTTRRQRTGLRLAAAGLAATGLVLGGIWWIKRGQDATLKSQDSHAATQHATLADLTAKLDEIKLDRTAAGKKFRNLTKADLERLLAEKAAITVEELRRRLATGAQSQNPLERARALLLQGDFAAALQATATLKETRTSDLIALLRVEAQAHAGQFQYQAALAARQQIAALTDKATDPAAWAEARHMVAHSLSDLGQDREAEPILREVIALRQRDPGPEHPDTLASRNNLAEALREQGKSAEAETEHRAVLAVRQRVLGPEHPDTLQNRNNLAAALGAQGKNAEAEAEHRAVLAAMERILGPEHSDTLTSRNNLAEALRVQGQPAEAETEHRAVLAVRQRVPGPEHPETLTSRNNLALALQEQGKNTEAEAEHRAVLTIMERVLGPEHPDTLLSHFNLAMSLKMLGDAREKAGEKEPARAHWRDALEHARTVQAAGGRVFGRDHPYLTRFARLVTRMEIRLKE